MADNNIFNVIRSLADSNTSWINLSQNLMRELVINIEKHLDNVDYVMKNNDKFDCDISDLQDIYSERLDVYEAIVDLMTKINKGSTKEIEIQKKMYNDEYQKYKDVFDALKRTK